MMHKSKPRLLPVGIALVVGALLASATQGQSTLVERLKAGRSQTVVVYGTSLTAAGGWVSQVGAGLDAAFPGQVKLVNSGGSGQYSAWGIQHLETHVIQKNPDTLFIEFSINDSVARFDCSVAQAKANLEEMITRTRKARPACEIILMTMTPGNKYPEGHRSHRKNIAAYYEMVREVADARGLLLIDHDPHWRALQADDAAMFQAFVPDTIHPTAAGNAEVVTPAILAALGMKAMRVPTILALGDSITQGGASFTCYREVLVPELARRGIPVTFIGPQKDKTSAHAGYGGNSTKTLRGKVAGISGEYPADIVLLHSGHNSFSKDNPVAGIAHDTEAILQTIHDMNPDCIVLLAQVIPAGKLPKYGYIPALNQALAERVARWNAGAGRVILVDQASGFDWQTDTVADKVHPNAAGAKKMADQWLKALLPLLQAK
jgi:acyl-CoA thioesterase I